VSVTDTQRSDPDDDEAPDIPPALSEDEWFTGRELTGGYRAIVGPNNALTITRGDGRREETVLEIQDVNELAAIIALANLAINPEDPRKFRREHVSLIREAAELLAGGVLPAAEIAAIEPTTVEAQAIFEAGEHYSRLHELADVLESYVPNELTESARITNADIDRVAEQTRRDNPEAARFLEAALDESAEERERDADPRPKPKGKRKR
jgi:hypothetical protein